jgi:hypothetical protein
MESAFNDFAAAEDLCSIVAAFDVLQQHSSKTDISEGPIAGSLTLLQELSRVVLPAGSDLYKALGPQIEQAAPEGYVPQRFVLLGNQEIQPKNFRIHCHSYDLPARVELVRVVCEAL